MGKISKYNKRKRSYTIAYDNGEKEDGVTLPDDTIRFIDDDNEQPMKKKLKVPVACLGVDPSSMKAVELRRELKARGLSTKGRKAELAERLAEHCAA